MKIIIDIPDSFRNALLEGSLTFDQILDVYRAIRKGVILPKGHGRMIDVDAIPEQIELKGFLSQDNAHLVTIDKVKEALNDAPTIIEADVKGEE